MSIQCDTAIMYGIRLTDEQMTEICDVHYDIREDQEYEDFIFFLNEVTGEHPFIGTYVFTIGEAQEICMDIHELNKLLFSFSEGKGKNWAKSMQKSIVDEIIEKLHAVGMELGEPTFYIATRIL